MATPTYGDVDLLVPSDEIPPEMWQLWLDVIESTFTLSDLYPFALPPPRVSLSTIGWPTPWDYRRDPQVRLNTLYWPTGASRWAYATFLVAEQELEDIRELAYEDDVYTALTLSLDDGTGEDEADESHTVETDLFMLPAIPIAPQKVTEISGSETHENSGLKKWRLPRSTRTLARTDGGPDGTEPCYLLPLVDERYFWWMRAANITLTEGTTTWATLYSSIATGLGISLTVESVNSAYLKPPAEFQSRYEYLPLLLDAVAHSVGQRVVRKLDGTVITQGAAAALTNLESQLALTREVEDGNFFRIAGGLLGLDV